MSRRFYGGLMLGIRILYRIAYGRYAVMFSCNPPVPSVYLVHHQDLRGPLAAMAWLDEPTHIWALGVFLTRRQCFRHYTRSTLTRRFGLPRTLAVAIALPASWFVASLLHSCKAIPVHRGSANILSTMNQTIAALKDHESVLISPDVDYTDRGPGMGEMYEGFLRIDRFYHRATKAHVGFVPVHIDRSRRAIRIGFAVRFPGTATFRSEKDEVLARIKREFARLERSAGVSAGVSALSSAVTPERP